MSKDYYTILNVPKDCNDKQLKKAYRKSALKWHPDKCEKKADLEKYEEKFKEINEAYNVLSDPKKRKIYDQYGYEGLKGGAGGSGGFGFSSSDARDIFEQFFGGDPFATIFQQSNMGGIPPGMGAGIPQGMFKFSNIPGGIPGMDGFGPSMGGRFGGSTYDQIAKGTSIIVFGLQSAPKHNGKQAQIQSYNAKSSRYSVQMKSGENIAIRGINLCQLVQGVKIVGIASKKEINGQKGNVIGFDPRGRYEIQLNGSSASYSFKPNNVVLPNNTCVCIFNLNKGKQYNGKWGQIQKFEPSSSRYEVQLSGKQILKLKLDNVAAWGLLY